MLLRSIVSVPFAALLALMVSGQGAQSALNLDGVNDNVSVPNAGGLLAGATGYTMTCWIRPTYPYPVAPNFDGICGFRNTTTADFSLVREGPMALRGRFQNSVGQVYQIMPAVIQVGVWQHVALVYNGSSLIMYYNGTIPTNGQIQANGWMGGAIGPFNIGKQKYNATTDFFLEGDIDEVSLWSVALTPSEIQCVYESGIDPASTGLQLFYKMDEGIPGGNNTALPGLLDATGHINGTFAGIDLVGAASNFVAGPPVGNTQSAQMCAGETYTFNGQVLTQPGIYTTTYPTGGTCDSLVTLVLNVATVNTTVLQQNGMLISQANNAQYQWLDCANGYTPIPGATNAIYTPAAAGSYAVALVQSGCADTSACQTVVGVEELSPLAGVAVRYDAHDDAVVITGTGTLGTGTAVLFDPQGRPVTVQALKGDRALLPTGGLATGAYLVRVGSDAGQRSFRVAVVR